MKVVFFAPCTDTSPVVSQSPKRSQWGNGKKEKEESFLPSQHPSRTLWSRFSRAVPGLGSSQIRRHLFNNLAGFIHWKLSLLVPSKGRSTKSADMAKLEPMMRLVLHCIDRVRRFRLGKEVC